MIYIYIYIFLPDEQVVFKIDTISIYTTFCTTCLCYVHVQKKKNEHTLLSLGANGHTKKKKKKKRRSSIGLTNYIL